MLNKFSTICCLFFPSPKLALGLWVPHGLRCRCFQFSLFVGFDSLYKKFDPDKLNVTSTFLEMLTKKKDPKTWNSGSTTGKYLKKEAPSDVPSNNCLIESSCLFQGCSQYFLFLPFQSSMCGHLQELLMP